MSGNRYVIINGQRVYGDNSQGNSNSNQPRKKHSGANYGMTKGTQDHKGGKLFVKAWNYSKSRGLVTITAFENSKSKKYTSEKNQQKHIMLMFEIFYERTGNKILAFQSFNTTTGKVFIDQLGWVISCGAANGGFCGKWVAPNKRNRS